MSRKDSDETKLAVIQNDVGYIKTEVSEIKVLVETKYVTKDEFDPIKKLVYGITGLILTGVIVGLLSLVLKK